MSKTIEQMEWVDWTEDGLELSGRKIPLEHPKNTDCVYIGTLKREAIDWLQSIFEVSKIIETPEILGGHHIQKSTKDKKIVFGGRHIECSNEESKLISKALMLFIVEFFDITETDLSNFASQSSNEESLIAIKREIFNFPKSDKSDFA